MTSAASDVQHQQVFVLSFVCPQLCSVGGEVVLLWSSLLLLLLACR
jgi:hypothetical protein